MIRTTQVLRREHQDIQLLLNGLEALVARSRVRGEFDVNAAIELQALFEHLVDRRHQEKEEAALIPKLVECVRRLAEDHAAERAHLERMRFHLFNASLGDPDGRAAFLDDAEAYLDLQREHMARESLGLLPLADQLLSEQDDVEVIDAFDRLDDGGGFQGAEVQARLRRLCERLGVVFERAIEAGC